MSWGTKETLYVGYQLYRTSEALAREFKNILSLNLLDNLQHAHTLQLLFLFILEQILILQVLDALRNIYLFLHYEG